MKNHRQSLILDIIARRDVETQEQLLACLRERGVHATQATISRDIKELHLMKEPAGAGTYKYAVSGGPTRLNAAEKLRTIFRESVLSVQTAQNLVVLKTMPGLAGAAGAALDAMDIPDMVGSLAGDDTAFLAMRDTQSAAEFCEELKRML